MKILLDNNSFDFLLVHMDKIKIISEKHTLYYILSQEIELDKLGKSRKTEQLEKYINLIKIKNSHSSEVPGGFMINAPCVNRPCLFFNSEVLNKCSDILKKHHCMKNNRLENFTHDLNLATTAYIGGYAVLTNDGTGVKDGLYPALKELGIECYSHSEFLNLI